MKFSDIFNKNKKLIEDYKGGYSPELAIMLKKFKQTLRNWENEVRTMQTSVSNQPLSNASVYYLEGLLDKITEMQDFCDIESEF
jgi:hypothetical protein